MPTSPDPTHLAALITAALAEAERLGPPAAGIADRLGALARDAEALSGRDGAADQGTRLDDLTTDNDQ